MYPNLKLQIWRSGIRQNRLAQLIGVDETTLSRIINGFRKPHDEVKAKIAEVLHTDKDWLFEESPQNVTSQFFTSKLPPV